MDIFSFGLYSWISTELHSSSASSSVFFFCFAVFLYSPKCYFLSLFILDWEGSFLNSVSVHKQGMWLSSWFCFLTLGECQNSFYALELEGRVVSIVSQFLGRRRLYLTTFLLVQYLLTNWFVLWYFGLCFMKRYKFQNVLPGIFLFLAST